MLNNILAEYINASEQDLKSKKIFDTKNDYEFNMVAIYVKTEWYALIESPDQSRVIDIDEVINEEFQVKVVGWCVLKKYQKKMGERIPFSAGGAHYDSITLDDHNSIFWLLAIKPESDSRLFAG